jgi:hypothetical protein
MYLAKRIQHRETSILRKPIRQLCYMNPGKEKHRIHKTVKQHERLEHNDD